MNATTEQMAPCTKCRKLHRTSDIYHCHGCGKPFCNGCLDPIQRVGQADYCPPCGVIARNHGWRFRSNRVAR